MNEITTATASTLTTSIEKLLKHPTNPTTAVCIIVGLGLASVILFKAMDNGYTVNLEPGKIKFEPAR